MIRLEQPKNYHHAASMAVEIEVLPLEEPNYPHTHLCMRYLIDEHKVLEIESSIFRDSQQEPLAWLEKAVKTSRQELSARFGNMVGEHLIYIHQFRIPKILLDDVEATEAEPYPFFAYDIEILVNPDPDGMLYAGIGMHFTCLGYSEIMQFLSQFRDEVSAAFAG